MTELVATSLIPAPGHLLDPQTGELIELAEAEDDRVAEILARLKDLEAQLKQASEEVKGEVIRRMDKAARWTLEAGEWRLKSSSPGVVDYDQKLLKAELNGLVSKGVIDSTAVGRAFTTRMTESVSKSGVNALLKLGGEVKDAIERCQRPARRSVTLEENA
jgi:hypothetical protein